MKRALLVLAVALLPALAAGDEQAKKELQEDICWQWEKAHAEEYSQRRDDLDAERTRTQIAGGYTKYMLAFIRQPPYDRLQQLCERYFERYGDWPQRCCGVAPLMLGTVGQEAKDRGRADRDAMLERNRN